MSRRLSSERQRDERDLRVLAAFRDGLNSSEIAERLGIRAPAARTIRMRVIEADLDASLPREASQDILRAYGKAR